MTAPLLLHPETAEFAEHLALEFNLRHGDAHEPLAWYRAKWDAIATGVVSPTFAFEYGVGCEAAALFADGSLRRAFTDSPDDLATVLAWLAAWLEERRGARS